MEDLPALGERISVIVETLNGTGTHEGLVLPSAAPKHLTMKLDNGYNVNYPTSAIQSWTVQERIETPMAETSFEPSNADHLPRVRLIHTGGTIASKVDYITGAVEAKFEPEEMMEAIPELASIAQLEAVKIGNMFSDDIRPQHWNLMIKACDEAFADGCRGVVISHGTDTLHITSAALAFAFAGTGGRPAGPIALVGSQRSSDRGSSDATENLLAAVHWAAHGPLPTGHASDATVVIMHHGQSDGVMAVHSGLAVRKLHSSRRDAFQSVNAQPLARMTLEGSSFEISLNTGYEQQRADGDEREVTQRPTTYEERQRIAQFVAGPWLHAEHIEAVVGTGCQGVVIHGTGLGHLPIDDPQKDAPENTALWRGLTRCVNRNLPVVIINQCIHGPVDMHVYSKGRKQISMGLLGHGISSAPETTITKLHWTLSQNKDPVNTLTQNLCGEHQNNLFE
ncbi:MAG: Glu-tRNA(Gln) amidotransferase subunit GatD [Candidatus Poseidonia sp.]|nr:Glu-tRNA(Gln) amidotransferase subunit GatD [Poseidonia sp.]